MSGLPDLSALVGDADLLAMWGYESDFGLAEVAATLAEEFSGRGNLRCLEVGCGPGLLLAKLQRRFSDFSFEGIEPVGAGFSKTEAPLQRISAALDLPIHRCAYEDFAATNSYDLIFSINVFEHVADWRHYLTRTYELLARGGVSLIMCPNQAFPLESHFLLPIVFTKAITGRLFATYIRDFERERHCEGLWDALNFVKRNEVAGFLTARGTRFHFDEHIMERMVARMFTDPHFQKRFAAFRLITRLAHHLRIPSLLAFPGVRAFAPFMKLTVSKPT